MTRCAILSALSVLALVAATGCVSIQEAPPSWSYGFHWRGMTSNVRGSELPADFDRVGELFLLSWLVLVDRDDRVVCAFWDGTRELALIIDLRRSAQAERWNASTADGTLRAWLDRGATRETSDHYARWNAVLQNAERVPDHDLIPLEGSVEVRQVGDLPTVLTLELTSRLPVPLDTRFFQQYREVRWQGTDEEYAERLDRPDRVRATFRGRLVGYWDDANRTPWWWI